MSGHTPCPCCVCAKACKRSLADLPRPVDRHWFQACSLTGRALREGHAVGGRAARRPRDCLGGARQQATPGPLMPGYQQPNSHRCRGLVGTAVTRQPCGRLASVQPGQSARAARQGGTSWASHVGSLARGWPRFWLQPCLQPRRASRVLGAAQVCAHRVARMCGMHGCKRHRRQQPASGCCSDQRRAHRARGNHQNGGIHSMQHNGMLLQFCAEAGCRIFGVLIFCAGTVLCSLWISDAALCVAPRGRHKRHLPPVPAWHWQR